MLATKTNVGTTKTRPDSRTPRRFATAMRITAPQASEEEWSHAELVEQAELLDAPARDIRRLCAELNKESLSACGWMGDLPRHLMNQSPSRHRPENSALPTDLPALDRRGLTVLFAVTLIPSPPSIRRGRLGDIAESICLLALLPLVVVATGLFESIRG